MRFDRVEIRYTKNKKIYQKYPKHCNLVTKRELLTILVHVTISLASVLQRPNSLFCSNVTVRGFLNYAAHKYAQPREV